LKAAAQTKSNYVKVQTKKFTINEDEDDYDNESLI